MSHTDYVGPQASEPIWATTPPLQVRSTARPVEPSDDAIALLRRKLSEPIEYSELDEHDPDDQQHLLECWSCSYEVMRADIDPPDIGRDYDDHPLGYSSRYLPLMSIDQVREELGADGFSVTWANVGR
jgi:hypothetical protein